MVNCFIFGICSVEFEFFGVDLVSCWGEKNFDFCDVFDLVCGEFCVDEGVVCVFIFCEFVVY